eukprot:15479990-Alexandrium_andersonii.AAC.1
MRLGTSATDTQRIHTHTPSDTQAPARPLGSGHQLSVTPVTDSHPSPAVRVRLLEVTGPGALEGLAAPPLLALPGLAIKMDVDFEFAQPEGEACIEVAKPAEAVGANGDSKGSKEEELSLIHI